MSKMNRHLSEQEIREMIAGDDSDFVESEHNFNTEESENDESVEVIPTSISK